MVVVSLHAGIWHKHNPSMLQKKYVKHLTKAGADVIVGSGPHVLQPVEKIECENGRKSVVFYSLGDFIGSGFENKNDFGNGIIGGIGKITVSKGKNNRLEFSNISIIPTVPYKKQDMSPKIFFAEGSYYSKTEDVVDTVLNGSFLDRFVLSHIYLFKIRGGHIFILDDIVPNHWILFKWKIEELLVGK